MNIEETITAMSPEQVEQESNNYKAKLDSVSVKYHHNAKLLTLVNAWQAYEEEQLVRKPATSTLAQRRIIQRQEQLKLIRVRITNHNPSKRNISGEIATVANSVLGAVSKLIPYNCDAADSYHIPFILLNSLKARVFTARTSRTINGRVVVSQKEVPEFSFEVLEPLSETDLKVLARKQAMANGVEVD